MASKGKTVIVVAGPTASGKTAVAIELARHFATEIISCDSRQCFRELNTGVARPSEEELAIVPHHFIATHSIHEEVTAVTFEQYALQKCSELFRKYDVVIMAGGTGLYIKAFCGGFDKIPDIDPGIRSAIISAYETNGLQWLQQQVKEKDPLFFTEGEMQNPQRIMRALEVLEGTGRSILSFRKGQKQQRGFNILKIGLELPREELYRNINERVDSMMKNGLLEEVKSLTQWQYLNALQTVGYKELFEFLNGSATLETAIEKIKLNTRHYAKRQLTWFKKEEGISWFNPHEPEKIKRHLEGALNKQ